MTSYEEKLNQVLQSRDDIKTAIEGKGQTVNTDIRTYAEAINKISTLAEETADATVTSKDIIKDKVAYNASGKVTGTLAPSAEIEVSTTEDCLSLDEYSDLQVKLIPRAQNLIDADTLIQGKFPSESVASKIGLTADKIIEGESVLGINGTAKAGGDVNGVKLFKTVEEMQADPSIKEGDLAVIYRNEIQNMTANMEVITITFPEKVVLSEAFTGNSYCKLDAQDSLVKHFDANIVLQQSMFIFSSQSDTGEIRVQYTSADGITYTRTTFQDANGNNLENPANLGTNAVVENTADWSDTMGQFMLINTIIFEGLYQYKHNKWVLVQTQLNATSSNVYKSIFYGKNGVETGTLTENISNSFADINAEVYDKIQKAYATMEPKVLTDTDKTVNKNIYFIPVNTQGEPLLNTSKVTDMDNMFERCTNLTAIPLLNTSNVTRMSGMFNECKNLTTIPLLDTSKVITMSFMFQYTNLTTMPLLDTSKVTNMNNMFFECTNLTTIPLLDTSKVTDISYMFMKCTNLTAIPLLNTSSTTNMDSMFNKCANLTTIPLLNTSKVTRMYNMFDGCEKLSDDSLNNILAMCTNAATDKKAKTLKLIGLNEEQATKCKTLSNYSAFTSAGWTTGY